MADIKIALNKLLNNLGTEETRTHIPFHDFLQYTSRSPEKVFRNIFQLVNDMVHHYVEPIPMGVYDACSRDFVDYDTTRLLVEGTTNPFFADRLFAKNLVETVDSFRLGNQQNKIYNYEGPPGCGKTTFLNNFLAKLEKYTYLDEGACFEVVWKLDKTKLSTTPADDLIHDYLEVPCPSHDNPLLVIPKAHRHELLDEIISDSKFKERLFSKKEYEWVFKWEPCTICTSIYDALLEKRSSAKDVFEMLFARRYHFSRKKGEGIGVFNPQDDSPRQSVMTNPVLQEALGELFQDSNKVKYVFSQYASTNNGVYAIMDVKLNNQKRFADLHNITSDGVHKVGNVEERVQSLLITVMNPEDRKVIKNMQSFLDRMNDKKMHYVREYITEVQIYKNTFGDGIEQHFLPRVLDNFAKIIVATRLNAESPAMSGWIKQCGKYSKFCDPDMLLLKMDIYAGSLPRWLSEDDKKTFTPALKKAFDHEAEQDGNKGFTGRESIDFFAQLLSSRRDADTLFNMSDVRKFFRTIYNNKVSSKFLDALGNLYDYEVLQEVKDSMYNYNEAQISRDIQNYLFGINFDLGAKVKCPYTGDDLHITDQFLITIEQHLIDKRFREVDLKTFREDMQKMYCSDTLSKEIRVEGRAIASTTQYALLFESYANNLKEHVLDPFINNGNFRNALRDYDTPRFNTYDYRITEDMGRVICNLQKKYKYTLEGARQICLYVVDNNLAVRDSRYFP